MIMGALVIFMEKFSKLSAFWTGLIFFAVNYPAVAGGVLSTGGTSFIATISDGTCDVSFDNQVITFMPRVAGEFGPGMTVEIKPVTAQMHCTYAVSPQVTVSGATYASNNRVFINKNPGWPDGVNGVGFMLQPAATVSERDNPPSPGSFYADGMAGKAIAAAVSMPLIPLTEDNDYSANQILWVGLVGLADSSQIVPGRFSANLTININLP